MPAVPTIGIGSSAASNGWILMNDVVSVFAECTPKFVNRYRNLGEDIGPRLGNTPMKSGGRNSREWRTPIRCL